VKSRVKQLFATGTINAGVDRPLAACLSSRLHYSSRRVHHSRGHRIRSNNQTLPYTSQTLPIPPMRIRNLLTLGMPALLSLPAVAATQAPRASAAPITIRWLGHATFEVTSPGGTRLLLDPFITGNPSTPAALKSLARYSSTWKPAAILVTHSHSDHSLDADTIARMSGAPVISAYEWVNAQKLPAAQAMAGNVGGTFKIGDVTVHIVPAEHSSDPGGRPVGFVIHFADGRTLYDTGDTWIFGDMSLIEELYHPSIILLGVGGGPYTEDPSTAALAVRKYFHPHTIIPMHYATFPGLATEAQVRAAFPNDSRLAVMKPGETRKF
jgi:L-ascorbate metabolism protein UlaG (beta-lactamase superfamily)